MKKFCKNCGQEIIQDASYCSNCGTNLNSSNSMRATISVGGNVGRDVISAEGDVTKYETNNITSQISPFRIAHDKLQSTNLAEAEYEDAKLALEKLEKQDEEGKADTKTVSRWLDILEAVAPTVAKVLIEAILNPGAAASTVMKQAVKQVRKS